MTRQTAGGIPIACAFAPSHMTGFFALGMGTSYGAGITLSKGCATECRALAGKPGKAVFRINGKLVKKHETRVSRLVLRKFALLFPAFFKSNSLSIAHSHDFPCGFGMGSSASAALSLSLALNRLLGSPLSRAKAVKIAAEADLECGCGVLGVYASATGGFLAKKSPKSAVSRLLAQRGCTLLFGFLSPISTKAVLGNKKTMESIGRAGAPAAKEFFKAPTLYNLALVSNRFAIDSGIAKGKAKKLLLADRQCGMAMLGNTFFWVFPDMQSALLARKHYAKQFKKMELCSPSEKGAMLA